VDCRLAIRSSLLATVLASVPLAASALPVEVAGGTSDVTLCGSAPTAVTRAYSSDQARTYDYVPFTVPDGAVRVEVGYRWVDHAVEQGLPDVPITQTVFDLGLWNGPTDDDANLVGWSGSRQGRLDQEKPPVWVAANSAERGYRPVTINPGPWHVEVGVAAVGPMGATVHLEVACYDTDELDGRSVDDGRDRTGPPSQTDAVRECETGAESGGCWYHADFHLHGRHSNPGAPDWADLADQVRAAALDIAPVTDYVTTAHWDELGAAQQTELASATESNPDAVLIWPGREIITYFGHAIALAGPDRRAGGAIGDGAPRHDVDYRHGYQPEGRATPISIADIVDDATGQGDRIHVAHPTIFPGPLFRSFCRGCEFELTDQIPWHKVSGIEVVTGPVLADLSDLSGSFPSTHSAGGSLQNPFIEPAIDFWEDRLAAGFKIAPVSGSDSKGVDDADQRERKGYGSSATAILAAELSIDAIRSALDAGHVYVRTRGVAHSPTLDVEVVGHDAAGNRSTGTFGDLVPVSAGLMAVTVGAPEGGTLEGQYLRIVRNGNITAVVPLRGESQKLSIPVIRVTAEERQPEDGGTPLGTFWRVDVGDARSLTAIGNAVFLTGS